MVNVKDEILNLYAFRSYIPNNNVLAVDNEADRDALTVGTKKTLKMYWKASDGKFYRYGSIQGSRKYLFGGYGAFPVSQSLGPVYGVSWCDTDTYNKEQFFKYSVTNLMSISLKLGEYLKLPRASSLDTRQNEGEVWNGNSKRSGKYKTVSSYSANSIVIEGVTYNRYTAGDEGTLADKTNAIIVYANTETLSVGQSVYNEPALTNEYGKVSSVNGTNYNIEGRVFVPSPSDNDTGGDTVYYKIAPVFPDIGTTTYTGTPTGDTVTYNPFANTTFYPNEAKILTDSKWDKDRWVNTGQITKRFPIDRQYFQTLQIEFCGETEDQGIELYGFEIDGIQLTEVPW